jgi:Raf kinase inhibitor-like YbhB/YbcL family protein
MSSITNAVKLSVTSSAFTDGGMIPSKYTCEGSETSPPLKVTDIPDRTKSLSVIVNDPDAPVPGGFTHWVIWNLDNKGIISEGCKSGEQGLNGANKSGYKGMCPPTGTHHYHFKVYALDARMDIDKNSNKAALEKAMEGHILGEGELVGLYAKTKH